MSFILDALRRSELDRQLASGPMASVLCPVLVETRRASPKYILSAVAGLAAFIVMLSWWSVSRQLAPSPVVSAVFSPVVSSPVVPSPVAVAKPVVGDAPPAAPVQGGSSTASPQKPKSSEPAISSRVATAKLGASTLAIKSDSPVPVIAGKSEAGAGTLPKDLPALTIAGYIRDEQGGSLAMINEKLVREGEEVVPGLRLEKILGDRSIFTYRGYRFER